MGVTEIGVIMIFIRKIIVAIENDRKKCSVNVSFNK